MSQRPSGSKSVFFFHRRPIRAETTSFVPQEGRSQTREIPRGAQRHSEKDEEDEEEKKQRTSELKMKRKKQSRTEGEKKVQ